jgi:hypothetical protein
MNLIDAAVFKTCLRAIIFFLWMAILPWSAMAQVAQWQLNNNATDASGNSITGTLMNSPVFITDSKEGSHAISLNGTNQYIDFGNPTGLPAGTSPRTISAWARTNTVAAGVRWIFAYGTATTSKAMFIGQSGTQLVGGGYANNLAANNFWAVGVWRHICLTYDGTTARLYADGVQVASAAKTWDLTLLRCYIGRQVTNSEYWNGDIDDVRVYNTALTATEVQAIATAPPAAPTALTVSTVSSTTVTLGWTDASVNETGFQIERSTTSGSGYSLITTTAANAVSYTDNGLTPGTTYYYRIRSVNAGGTSVYTSEITATTVSATPTAPSGLAVSATTATAITLGWTDASNNETGFEVERSLTTGSGYSIITTTAANVITYSDAGLTPGTTYYYRIRAVNAGGNSAYTSEVSATTISSPPSAPSALTATAASSTAVSLNWRDASGNETGFQIERTLTSGTGFTLITTTAANAVSYIDVNRTANTTYYYRVRAVNASGSSSYTTEVSVTTALTPPLAPTGLTVVSIQSTSAAISWTDNSANETEFEIERSSTSGIGFNIVGTAQANEVSFTDATLSPSTTYYYRVRATNGSTSAYTSEVSVTTLAAEGGNSSCENIYCDDDGGVGIGTPDVPSGYLLAVKGKIMAEGVKVDLQSAWPDYVFEQDYQLTNIPTLKKYIDEHGHLPNMPSAKTVEKEGIDVGEINTLLLEKIEELSLYLIQMEERMRKLEAENKTLKEKQKK